MFNSLFGRRRVRGNRTIRNAVSRSRLAVNRLEARLAPAAFVVNSALDIANPPAGVVTLRSAILAANAMNNQDPNNPDTIGFAMNGPINLTSSLPALTGSISIQGPAAGADVLTVIGMSGNFHESIISVTTPAIARISGLGLDGNNFSNIGITVGSGARLSVQNVRFTHTGSLGAGAAIANNGGTVDVAQSQFISNHANTNGGGISNMGGALTVLQSTFDGNLTGDYGGGIYVSAPVGPAVGTLTVIGCTFSNNQALSLGGGGIAVGNRAQATVVNSTFNGNSAGYGGGIAVYGSPTSLQLHGGTLAGNTAFADQGGGLSVQFTATATLIDTIVAGNAGGDVIAALAPNSAANLIGDGTGMTGLINGANGNLIGTAATPINPMLGALADNGGPTKTLALLPGSPALDRGAPSSVADALTTVDACGNPRVVGQSFLARPASGDGRDIGAYELPTQMAPTVLTVNSLSDAPGSPPPGILTLRQAISAANGVIPFSALPPSQISPGSPYLVQFQFSMTGTIGLTSALPAVGANTCVGLQGPGATALTIIGDGLADTILTVASGGAAVVGGLTLDGAYHNAALTAATNASLVVLDAGIQNAVSNGGAALAMVTGSLVSVVRSRIASNHANTNGGGISNMGGALTVLQSTFDGNLTGDYGGGIYVSAAGRPGRRNFDRHRLHIFE